MTKYECCIYVDEEVMRAVLNGAEPLSEEEMRNPTAFVKLINEDYIEPPALRGISAAIGGLDVQDATIKWDEGFPPLENDRREDVGWMKVSPSDLLPRWYTLLEMGGWPSFYDRPPGIARR